MKTKFRDVLLHVAYTPMLDAASAAYTCECEESIMLREH